VLLALAGGLFLWRYVRTHPGPLTPEQSEARRRGFQVAALKRGLARKSLGSLLPPNDVTVAVREDFLQKVLASSLPFTRTFEDGRYIARLDSARVDLLDGLALVRLSGRGMSATDSSQFADLVLEGRLSIAGVDDSTGQLNPRLEITDLRVERAGGLLGALARNPAIRFFSNQKLQEWNDLQAAFHLPLKIESGLRLPPVEGDVALPEAHVGLGLKLSSVITLADRLIVSLRLLPEFGAHAVGPSQPDSMSTLPTFPSDLPGSDRATAEALSDSVRAFAATDSLWRAILLTDRDLVILTPRAVLAELAYRVARRYHAGARVDFRPSIHETIDKEIRIKLLGKRVGAGKIHVDIDVKHLVGRLETPGEPRVTFRPPDALEVALPIRIVEAGGAATFHAAWDPAAIVSVVCRGFETRQTLTGIARPLTHEALATIRFTLEENRILGKPLVRRDRIRLSFDLDEPSWKKVRAVFEEQDRFGRCGIGIDADTMVVLLRRLGMKGVSVRLPADLLPEFALPVSFADVYEQEKVRVAAIAFRPELLVRPEYLRFGVDADLRIVQRAGVAPSAPSIAPSRRARP
jgi:hypothetical protein